MLGALIHCWVHLAGVSGGVKLYSGSIMIIKNCPALSTALGGAGWDGLQQAPLDDVIYK